MINKREKSNIKGYMQMKHIVETWVLQHEQGSWQADLVLDSNRSHYSHQCDRADNSTDMSDVGGEDSKTYEAETWNYNTSPLPQSSPAVNVSMMCTFNAAVGWALAWSLI